MKMSGNHVPFPPPNYFAYVVMIAIVVAVTVTHFASILGLADNEQPRAPSQPGEPPAMGVSRPAPLSPAMRK